LLVHCHFYAFKYLKVTPQLEAADIVSKLSIANQQRINTQNLKEVFGLFVCLWHVNSISSRRNLMKPGMLIRHIVPQLKWFNVCAILNSDEEAKNVNQIFD